MRYLGRVKTGFGVATKDSHKWFNAWANSIGKSLYPGTLNIQVDRKPKFKGNGISLKSWDYLFPHAENSRRMANYDPKLFPAKLNGYGVWVFCWGWWTNTIEIVAEECLRDRFSLKDGDEVEIEIL